MIVILSLGDCHRQQRRPVLDVAPRDSQNRMYLLSRPVLMDMRLVIPLMVCTGFADLTGIKLKAKARKWNPFHKKACVGESDRRRRPIERWRGSSRLQPATLHVQSSMTYQLSAFHLMFYLQGLWGLSLSIRTVAEAAYTFLLIWKGAGVPPAHDATRRAFVTDHSKTGHHASQ